ncbi:alpha/beta fold hydrolase [Algisphaera agarilytica]|uniref:Pimeloyl-ACP methyl ester carboxylesterase n=1 Tax=Algisphaera agarilytica TaxID=1385975 RepID=A0A7X0LJX6_9BACT|nr:alpha/beta hydrolase [Algisphaera agarilytica]MBB6429317.1 pimeloyl-ACP methyl ester carboxylesterase [Algisphaera agarilytica]
MQTTSITPASADHHTVRYATEKVNGLDIFYREAGDPSKQAVVLLHGFPHSSHQYREVLAALGDEFYLIAPDYPGFGDSSFPAPRTEFDYTFDNLADVIDQFLIQRGVTDYVLMIQDYGAPVGFRIATRHPEKVKGFVVMNGNAYEEGISPEGWAPIMKYWENPGDPEIEAQIIANVFSDEGLRWQYTHGTRNPDGINPDNWNLDIAKFARPGQHRAQLDLFFDYQNNIKLYPQWQQYLRDNQPPVLLVWGKNDAFFPVPGAEGYKRDVKNIDYHILDTGHFALEEEAEFITNKMRSFLRGLD